MPLVIPPDFVQVAYQFQVSNDPEVMICSFGFHAPIFTGAPSQMVAIYNAFGDNLLNGLGSSTFLVGVEVREGPVGVGPTFSYVEVTQSANTNPQAPPNVAYLVQKRSSAGGRRNRGRFFLPGVEEANVDAAGNVTGTKLSSMQTAIDAFLVAAINEPVTGLDSHVILHSEPPAPVPSPTTVLTTPIQTKVATQRRRLRP